MKIRVFMLTYNRPGYTAQALARLCQTVPDDARVTVWDNASSRETHAVLKQFESHPAIEQIIYNKTNDKLRGPTNWFWENAGDAEFLSKVDDDCLMPEGWCEKLIEAHRDIPKAGVLGCWRFLDEDFEPELAARKIQTFGSHRIMRNCWIEGSGYLMKRAVVHKLGLLAEDESFTTYCTRAAAAGFINGWYYPFLYQEHMDDPRVPHTGILTEEDFQRLRPLSAGTFGIQTRQEWIGRLKHSSWVAQACSFDSRDYLGWKAKLRRRVGKLAGKAFLPRA